MAGDVDQRDDDLDRLDRDRASRSSSSSSYDLAVSLSESDIGKVKNGQMATVTVSATGKELAARVVDVGVLLVVLFDARPRARRELVLLERRRLPGDAAR